MEGSDPWPQSWRVRGRGVAMGFVPCQPCSSLEPLLPGSLTASAQGSQTIRTSRSHELRYLPSPAEENPHSPQLLPEVCAGSKRGVSRPGGLAPGHGARAINASQSGSRSSSCHLHFGGSAFGG